MQAGTIVVLGTGGTIAGTSTHALDNIGYRSGQIGIEALVAGVPALAGVRLETEQVAQVDSKDMDAAVWQALVARTAYHVARPEVAGIVVAHGTDTMEETAWLLERVLAPAKPVVLTGAMRPATALLSDGPQNLLDAITVAGSGGARGVCVVFAGAVHAAHAVRKRSPYRLDAFDSGEAGPIARVEEGHLRVLRPWPPADAPRGAQALLGRAPADWPRVELVTSHAGADGRAVDLLFADGVHGFVVAGTGNGTLHHALEAALQRAQAGGAQVLRTTRCADGTVVPAPGDRLPSVPLTPVQARIELLLALLDDAPGVSPPPVRRSAC